MSHLPATKSNQIMFGRLQFYNQDFPQMFSYLHFDLFVSSHKGNNSHKKSISYLKAIVSVMLNNFLCDLPQVEIFKEHYVIKKLCLSAFEKRTLWITNLIVVLHIDYAWLLIIRNTDLNLKSFRDEVDEFLLKTF